MTIYYLSSKSGSDTNSGTSANQAWSSFSKLSGKIRAGDTILLERGSDFDQTLTFSKVNGTATMPITISAYGAGDAPILSSENGGGISASNSSYYIVENITIQGTSGVGMYGWNANNWVIQNVTFDNVGGNNNAGSLNWTKSSNILFQNNTVTNSHGDGIYMTSMNNVAIVDSEFLNVTGTNADNIQIVGTNTLIAGNVLIVDETSNTTKGNLVFQGDGLYAHDNYMQGGSFGMSISANNVVVENNIVKDHTKYSWSSNVMIIDQSTGDSVKNIDIKDNQFYNANRDINIDGKNTTSANMTVNNLEISGNEFHDWTKAPLALNGVNITSGTFENNVSDKQGSFVYATNSNTSGLASENNTYVPETIVAKPAPLPPPLKTITIVASGSQFDGAPILKLLVNGIVVAHQEVTALKSTGGKQTIAFEIPSFSAGDSFAIKYENDKYKVGSGDRNLYVHSVSLEGTALNLKSADLSQDIFYLKKEGNAMFFSSNATATFTSADVPENLLTKPVVVEQVASWPQLEDVLESDQHNINYGNETHTIGANSQSSYGASFADLTSNLADLHHALNTSF